MSSHVLELVNTYPSLKIFKSKTNLSVQQVLELPFTSVRTTWQGADADSSFNYVLAIDPNSLFLFGASKSETGPEPETKVGTFYEGLWNFDVIEFFLRSNELPYLEFHVAPKARWWIQSFSTPREKIIDQPIPMAEAKDIKFGNFCWATLLIIDRKSINKLINLEGPIYGNLCANVGATEKTLLSIVPFEGVKPNFHQPALFSKSILCDIKSS